MKDKILNNSDNYKITINNFEGPLDLLLYLITKNKMDIFDISLSDLTDRYIEYLNNMSDLNLDIASSFVLMASTLLDIKCKKLLPELQDESEDKDNTEEDILARIIEYKMYKEMSTKLDLLYKSNFGTFNKPMEKIKFTKDIKYTGKNFELNNIFDIYNQLLNRNINKINIKSKEIEKLTIHDKVTVKDQVKKIIKYLENNNHFIFNELFNHKNKDKHEVVAAFLGALELTKSKKIYVKQENLFSDIHITKNVKNQLEYDFTRIGE